MIRFFSQKRENNLTLVDEMTLRPVATTWTQLPIRDSNSEKNNISVNNNMVIKHIPVEILQDLSKVIKNAFMNKFLVGVERRECGKELGKLLR